MFNNVAVIGATGAVGTELIHLLEKRNFPLNKLRLFASERSEGLPIRFRDETIHVEKLNAATFKELDLAFLATSGTHAKEIAPVAVKSGTLIIDNSSAFRLDPHVPLVVPEVNGAEALNHNGIIANPNCSTIQMVAAINPIHKQSEIRRIIVSTYQAVSGAGKEAMQELENQMSSIVKGEEVSSSIFPSQIALNAIPHIDTFEETGYTREEMKMVHETRKILNAPDIKISATCVRIPVMRAHSEAISIETKEQISAKKARELLSSAPGIKLKNGLEPGAYPTPIEASNTEHTWVGRVREDLALENGLALWVVADQLWKGAALNAIQIAERINE